MILDFRNVHVHKSILIIIHFQLNLNEKKTLAFNKIITTFGNSGYLLNLFPESWKEIKILL